MSNMSFNNSMKCNKINRNRNRKIIRMMIKMRMKYIMMNINKYNSRILKINQKLQTITNLILVTITITITIRIRMRKVKIKVKIYRNLLN